MVALGDDFGDLLIALADEDTKFMVVGGWAAAGRPKDMADVKWLLDNPEPEPDE